MLLNNAKPQTPTERASKMIRDLGACHPGEVLRLERGVSQELVVPQSVRHPNLNLLAARYLNGSCRVCNLDKR